MAPSPLVELFKRGEVERDVRLLAAQGALAPRAHDQLAILVLLLEDSDTHIREIADRTIRRIPDAALSKFLARSDVAISLREFFAGRGILPAEPTADAGGAAGADASGGTPNQAADDAPLVVDQSEKPAEQDRQETDDSMMQRIAKMGSTERLRAAMKGSREMRAILIRDPNKMIAAAVLSSPKLSEQEVEAISRMANVSDDVLRTIGSNRAWTRHYGVVVGLTKNPKTPLAMSMNLMQRLTDRDLGQLSVDRNIPEPLRVAARKKMLTNTGKG